MRPLAFSTGTRAEQEGRSLAQVAKRLTGDELAFWCAWLRERGVYVAELAVLEAEAGRRGPHYLAGPLFRLRGKSE